MKKIMMLFLAVWAFCAVEPCHGQSKQGQPAQIIINEIMYQQGTDNSHKEYIEFYVISGGSLKGYLVTDQDGHVYEFPEVSVEAESYIVLHIDTGKNNRKDGVLHLHWKTKGPILNDEGDDLLLLLFNANDKTYLGDGTIVRAIPVDYVAYGGGKNSQIDPVPVSRNSQTIEWNDKYNKMLGGASVGQSVSLLPNGIDSDSSACFEKTGSNEARSRCSNIKNTTQTATEKNQKNKALHTQGLNNI